MKDPRALILYSDYLSDIAVPVLNKAGIKYFASKIDITVSIDEKLAKIYPSLIIIECYRNKKENLRLLKKCITAFKNSNIVFVTESGELNSCIKLIKAGADEVIFRSEIAAKINLFKKLAGSLNYKKSAVENDSQNVANIGSWIFNMEQNELFWSDITKRLHEVPENYAPNIEDAINFYNEGWSRDKLLGSFNELTQTGKKVKLELPLTTAKNNKIWVSAKGEAQFIGEKCVRLFGTFQDITAQKLLEKQLRDSELKYQKVVEASSDIIWEIEIGTAIVHYVNINSAKTKSFQEFRLGRFLRLIHDEDRSRFIKSMRNNILNPELNTWNCQYRIKNRTGNYVWIDDNASIIRNREGKALRIIGAAKNVTEKKNYIKKVENQNAAFQKISWTQSHILRSPVVNILGLLGLLKAELKANTQPKEVKEIKEIISLLDFAAHKLDKTIKETVKQSSEALEVIESEGFLSSNPTISIEEGTFL